MRVWQIAKLLQTDGYQIQSSEVLRFCRSRGVKVKSPSSRLEPILSLTIHQLMVDDCMWDLITDSHAEWRN